LPFAPVYDDWKREFERFDVTPETILVGHSCGGGFLVRWLSENDGRVGNVVLVAPWTDPNRLFTGGFFDFEIDPALTSKAKKITIFNSTDDDKWIHKTVQILRDKIEGIGYKEFSDMGHFVEETMKTRQFPELLEEVLA
jgi:predicted alpha/beta hydrolase family esterase